MGRTKLAVTLAGAVALTLALGGMAVTAQESRRGPAPQSTQVPPDLVLFNGNVATLDADDSFAEAVAIRDGQIAAVGRNGPIRAMARPGTQLVDLNGRTVVPGLIDGHLHGLRKGYHCWSHKVRLDLAFERGTALQAYADKGAEFPADTWIATRFGSWNVVQLDDPGMFTKDELDAALPGHPAFVEGFGFEGVQVNSRALDLLGLEAGDAGVAIGAETSEPTGQLTGPAHRLAAEAVGEQFQALSLEEQMDCLRDFIQDVHRVGLTSWDDTGGGDFFDPEGPAIEALRDHHGFQAVNQRLDRTNQRIDGTNAHIDATDSTLQAVPGLSVTTPPGAGLSCCRPLREDPTSRRRAACTGSWWETITTSPWGCSVSNLRATEATRSASSSRVSPAIARSWGRARYSSNSPGKATGSKLHFRPCHRSMRAHSVRSGSTRTGTPERSAISSAVRRALSRGDDQIATTGRGPR